MNNTKTLNLDDSKAIKEGKEYRLIVEYDDGDISVRYLADKDKLQYALETPMLCLSSLSRIEIINLRK